MIRVVIADDHALVREGLSRTLASAGDIEVVGEAGSSTELLDLAGRVTPDVALVDVSMPGIGFLETLRQLGDRFASLRVVVVSAHDDPEYSIRAIRAGALAYVDKARSADELIEAVRRAARGASSLTEEQNRHLVRELRNDPAVGGTTGLSEREYQVLGLLGAGKSVKEIAATLQVSVKTVSTFRTRLLAKLSLRTTGDLIRYALENDVRG
ncbi:MAG: response regulator [Gemmatimonadales bacterium]